MLAVDCHLTLRASTGAQFSRTKLPASESVVNVLGDEAVCHYDLAKVPPS